MLREAFEYPVGFSDHTMGIEIPIAAIALGAVIIEKHFTLDRDMFGWDHHMSCTPTELKAICDARDRIHSAMGNKRRVVNQREMSKRAEYRRSIISAKDLKAGTIISENDLDFRRPGTGISPFNAGLLIGKKLLKDIDADTLISFDDVQNNLA
jgi:N-acetylneuraminate synthase